MSRLGLGVLAAWVLLGAGRAPGQCEVDQIDVSGALAAEADVLVIGDPNGAAAEGEVFVFRRDGESWRLEQMLTSGVINCQNVFGAALALHEDLLVVGDQFEGAPECGSGAVYVYQFDGAEWQFEVKLVASDGAAVDRFGHSVATNGNVIVVGAPHDDLAEFTDAGSLYLFRHDGSGWTEQAKLPNPIGSGILFGWSLDMRDDILVAGSHAMSLTGLAFVYEQQGLDWTVTGKLAPSDATDFAWFARSVALAGDIALVGAPMDDGQIGSAFVFRRRGNDWIEDAKLTASRPVGNHPFFGWDVAITDDGGALLVGASEDSAAGFEGGALHVFRQEEGAWNEGVKFIGSGVGGGDQFGAIVVNLGTDRALVGSIPATYEIAGIAGIDCDGNDQPDACDIFTGRAEDLDGDGVPDDCEIPGDVNGDGAVNVKDLIQLILSWGDCPDACPPSCPGDLVPDCAVNVEDLVFVVENWKA